MTNLDDIVVLTFLFSRLDQRLRLAHVVAGQFIGFSLLVLISLVGLLGRCVLPLSWLGLLGLLPISLGLSGVLEGHDGVRLPDPQAFAGHVAPAGHTRPNPAHGLGDAFGPMCAVTLLTLANGSDNIGVYLPLFARSSAAELGLILSIFAGGLLLWCLVAWRLTCLPGVADRLRSQGAWLTPTVLIGLGIMVLWDSGCLKEPALVLLVCSCLAVMIWPLLRHAQVHAPADHALQNPEPASSLTTTDDPLS